MSEIRANISPPTPQQQADGLVVWLGGRLSLATDQFEVGSCALEAILGTDFGWDKVSFILDELAEGARPLLKVERAAETVRLGLTFSGWQRYEVLKQSSIVSRTGFMAMKYNDPATREIYDRCFKPACSAAGFRLFRNDEIQKPGLIDAQMMVDIRTAAFLVADLTGHSLGVYWEAGFAAGLGKPVIYTCERQVFEAAKTHFDVNHHATILWSNDNQEAAGRELKAMIRLALPELAKMTDD
jgi:hypothetical protein